MGEIFVFGSNLAGRHGRGAALTARQKYGAEYGVGEGLTGRAYAIPTRDMSVQTLPLIDVAYAVQRFLKFAETYPELTFVVTPIGTGLAGFGREQITPLFKNAPPNCIFRDENGNDWRTKGTPDDR